MLTFLVVEFQLPLSWGAEQSPGIALASSDLDQFVGQLVSDDSMARQKALDKLGSLNASSKRELVPPLIAWMTSYDGEAEPDRALAVPALTKMRSSLRLPKGAND